MNLQYLMYKHIRKETPYEAYFQPHPDTSSTSRRSSRRKNASGYKNEGIKDILEYHYAGDYRDVKVAKKCNNE